MEIRNIGYSCVYLTITVRMQLISSKQGADLFRSVAQNRFVFRSLSMQVKGHYAHIFQLSVLQEKFKKKRQFHSIALKLLAR